MSKYRIISDHSNRAVIRIKHPILFILRTPILLGNIICLMQIHLTQIQIRLIKCKNAGFRKSKYVHEYVLNKI